MGAVITGVVLVSEMIGELMTVLVIMPPVDPDVMVVAVSIGIEGFGTLGIELADTGSVTTVVSGIVPVDPNVIVVTMLVTTEALSVVSGGFNVDPDVEILAGMIEEGSPAVDPIGGSGACKVVAGMIDVGTPAVDPIEGSGTCELLAGMIDAGTPAVDPIEGSGTCELLAGMMEEGSPTVGPTEDSSVCVDSDNCVVAGKIVDGSPPVDATEGATDTLSEGCSASVVALDTIDPGRDRETMPKDRLDEDRAVWVGLGTDIEADSTEDCEDDWTSVFVAVEVVWLVAAKLDESVTVGLGTSLLIGALVELGSPGIDRETGEAISVVLDEITLAAVELCGTRVERDSEGSTERDTGVFVRVEIDAMFDVSDVVAAVDTPLLKDEIETIVEASDVEADIDGAVVEPGTSTIVEVSDTEADVEISDVSGSVDVPEFTDGDVATLVLVVTSVVLTGTGNIKDTLGTVELSTLDADPVLRVITVSVVVGCVDTTMVFDDSDSDCVVVGCRPCSVVETERVESEITIAELEDTALEELLDTEEALNSAAEVSALVVLESSVVEIPATVDEVESDGLVIMLDIKLENRDSRDDDCKSRVVNTVDCCSGVLCVVGTVLGVEGSPILEDTDCETNCELVDASGVVEAAAWVVGEEAGEAPVDNI
ncbi:MAG: hypothetical protein Q9187_001074 [Circinaria calcarea]